jgi:hypothetical protein
LTVGFGLGDAATVDVMRIEWPSGIIQEVYGTSVDQTIVLTEAPRLRIFRDSPVRPVFAVESYGGSNYGIESSTNLSTWAEEARIRRLNGIVKERYPFKRQPRGSFVQFRDDSLHMRHVTTSPS